MQTLTASRELSEWFEKATVGARDVKKVANWILAEVLAVINERGTTLAELPFQPQDITALANAVDSGKITGKQAKEVFAQMLETGEAPDAIIAKSGYVQISDVAAIEKIVDQVLAENAAAVDDWKHGKTNAAGWLMGQVMKKSQGKANPAEATRLVNEKLKAL